MRFLQEPALSLPKGWAAMLPAQLLSVLHYPLWMPSLSPPFAKYAKDEAPALGRTQFQTLTIKNEPRLESAKPSTRAKWRSRRSAYRSALQSMLDTADIVLEIEIYHYL